MLIDGLGCGEDVKGATRGGKARLLPVRTPRLVSPRLLPCGALGGLGASKVRAAGGAGRQKIAITGDNGEYWSSPKCHSLTSLLQ